jgi:hypothetical protein
LIVMMAMLPSLVSWIKSLISVAVSVRS